MPQLSEQMQCGRIESFHIAVGGFARKGSSLVRVHVELSGTDDALDCPPMFYFEIVAAEDAYVRRWERGAGEIIETGAVLGLLSARPDEAITGAEGVLRRPLRVSCREILA